MQDYLVIILPLVWAVVIAFGIFVYVLLDGFDLGLGLLFLAAPSHAARDTMMRSVAPVWDGNETWLVLGGAALFAAFPLAYAVILPALYLPLVLMLIGLILRGVAFEFRFKADTLALPVGLGLRRRLAAGDGHAGPRPRRLHPGLRRRRPALCRRRLRLADAVLDPHGLRAHRRLHAARLRLAHHEDGGRAAATGPMRRPSAPSSRVVGFILVVSLWTPLQNAVVAARWFSWPNIVMFSPVPIVTAAVVVALYRALRLRRVYLPFVLTAALFVLSYTGIAVSFFPYIIPPDITIWQAASPPETQSFLLVGLVPILPIILGYTAWNYYVFRGRVREGDGYH